MTPEEKSKIFELEFYPQAEALYNFAYSLTRREAEAEDLVQETYIKAFRFVGNYVVGTNAKAWLFRILKNTFIDQYNKKSKRPTQVDIDEITTMHKEADSLHSSYVDIREDIFDNILGDEVSNAIDQLSVDRRVVLLLRDVEGFSYEEIAKIIEKPVNTVKTRLFRARNDLKKLLEDYAKSMGFKDHRK